ncbi:hypothetical protein G3O08_17600 [Cryomorpha ignava]|uniref:Uncharacterized protein n=1 Tax=Cryomorpha ignava TaxID=101383 RepID=A0A7K3WXF2_9FLAO|nr:hypothetical protein [Cryomorpha ignava]NEN25315.1 hypothetical protein [Cryomorpha ignava]
MLRNPTSRSAASVLLRNPALISAALGINPRKAGSKDLRRFVNRHDIKKGNYHKVKTVVLTALPDSIYQLVPRIKIRGYNNYRAYSTATLNIGSTLTR